jgi:hypothetical protein
VEPHPLVNVVGLSLTVLLVAGAGLDEPARVALTTYDWRR